METAPYYLTSLVNGINFAAVYALLEYEAGITVRAKLYGSIMSACGMVEKQNHLNVTVLLSQAKDSVFSMKNVITFIYFHC